MNINIGWPEGIYLFLNIVLLGLALAGNARSGIIAGGGR